MQAFTFPAEAMAFSISSLEGLKGVSCVGGMNERIRYSQFNAVFDVSRGQNEVDGYGDHQED